MSQSTEALLNIQHLRIALPAGGDRSHALHDLSLQLRRGECLCVVGESGSGKSMLAKALLRLLPRPLRVESGRLEFRGQDLAGRDEEAMRQLRGRDISMIFQEPMSALNPLLSVGRQIDETLQAHGLKVAGARRQRVIELLGYVGLPDPARLRHAYPFELSGGQRQRVVIAMALAFDPALLIADEPTSALDVTTQGQILDLLRRIQREKGMAMLFITHDFAVVEAVADRVLVLEKGHVVEQGPVAEVLRAPRENYTRRLLEAVAAVPLQPRQALAEAAVVLSARQLEKSFRRRGGGWRRHSTRALAEVDLELREGQTLGIVGESGSGKSTLGRCLVRLLQADRGSIQWQGREVAGLSQARLRPLRGAVQMIFQDPFASLNPRQSVGTILMTGPLAQGWSKVDAERQARRVLELVGLPATALERYPHEFSGGQRQRIGIARALAVEPKVLIADECVSALDALIQVQILELLEALQRDLGLSLLFITHDLRVAARLCDRIAVMHGGQVVEQGETATLLARPRHAYTQILLRSFSQAVAPPVVTRAAEVAP
ncbi:Oligopeptide transport ATP-binding protein OppD [Pseudomonas chlororaphis subsp. aurantiaca]|uniref:dipeptide ABC transporter ATP-binding protein n=1 Tax=Pseudomonas chlororaphis TaxID=587753 RepID=UPI00087BEF53|nr:ABC transporter ATP-binding protein [Pseudomonas chlororaphis]AZD36404.1 Oligopeptide transport ATP-binding protein OppD [Pseudomonas chlororaphis subsp. aurantiaca]AZD42743.1 Oligopeptide transport ATP-binding protein OppD [Pseudomonas chlororaphis subsp. aurantiaca]AZD67678.1 Oligopeptide transport ATP-binding protein OppD [Pseudomonas chlororaphis subsp. aurantiaca]QIT23642.1 ABC transporter ATP-binding protein [Pseudomonas chlororaphis subsp. aurantiaca]WDH01738.1 ABC transporter ATP-bi